MSYAIAGADPPVLIDTVLATTALSGSRKPQDTFHEAAVVADRLDGNQQHLGFPYVVWRFGILDQTMIDNLRALCPGASAVVVITTRNAAGVFTNYNGILLWPADLAARRQIGGRYVNVEFTIRRLEAYP